MSRTKNAVMLVATAIVAVVGLAGCAASAGGAAPAATPSATHTAGAGAASGIQDPDTRSLSNTPAAGVVPTGISIPAIGVSSSVMQPLAIGAGGELDPPTNAVDTGWYAKGVVPGAVGPAIIAGHIDSTTGPGVFLHLAKLTAGDRFTVTMSSGAVETWAVTATRAALKSAFPTSDVYGTSPTPQLRLITCGGVFDPKVGHYDENTIVFADLVSATGPKS